MRSLTIIVCLTLLPYICVGWGNLGHRTTVLLAERLLNPDGLVYARSLLGPDDLSDTAIWADIYKTTAEGKHTASWHFVDAHDDPPHTCNVSLARDCLPSRTCVIEAISNMMGQLQNDSLGWDEHHRAFAFLIHLVGDIHHPLHVESVARGGNDIPVQFDGHVRSLHFVWDVYIPQKITQTNETNERAAAESWAAELYHHLLSLEAGGSLPSRSSPWIRREATQLGAPQEALMVPNLAPDVLAWAQEANQYVCDYVLAEGIEAIRGKEVGGLYYQGAVPIVETLLVNAATRLAACINMLAAHSIRKPTVEGGAGW